jgi:hypothetical protein
MEDKLRYVLSVRTLIEMSLIRASRIATTATVEELMRAVRALKSDPEVKLPEISLSVKADDGVKPEKIVEPTPPAAFDRCDILDDPKLNAALSKAPGSYVIDIRETKK